MLCYKVGPLNPNPQYYALQSPFLSLYSLTGGVARFFSLERYQRRLLTVSKKSASYREDHSLIA